MSLLWHHEHGTHYLAVDHIDPVGIVVLAVVGGEVRNIELGPRGVTGIVWDKGDETPPCVPVRRRLETNLGLRAIPESMVLPVCEEHDIADVNDPYMTLSGTVRSGM